MMEVLTVGTKKKEARGCPMVVFRMIRRMDQIFPTKILPSKMNFQGAPETCG